MILLDPNLSLIENYEKNLKSLFAYAFIFLIIALIGTIRSNEGNKEHEEKRALFLIGSIIAFVGVLICTAMYTTMKK